MKRVYKVEWKSPLFEDSTSSAVFSKKKEAQYFIENVYPKLETSPLKIETITFLDNEDLKVQGINHPNSIGWFDRENRFVYEVHLKKEDWSVTFIGYHMDTAERHDIVFGYPDVEFDVVILATTYQDALDKGKKAITEAIKGGPFDKDYKKPGYIKYTITHSDKMRSITTA